MKIYLAVHSIRCPNTVGAAGEGFVAVVALDRLDGGVGGDHPLEGFGRVGRLRGSWQTRASLSTLLDSVVRNIFERFRCDSQLVRKVFVRFR